MLDKAILLDYIKRLDNEENLEKSEVNIIVNSFKNKIINNIENNKKHKKMDFEKIIPNEEYSILLRIEDLNFDVNEYYMDLLNKYGYKIYVNEDNGDTSIIKI